MSALHIMEEVDNLIISFSVKGKKRAQKFQKMLHHNKICGKKWNVQYVPLSDTICNQNNKNENNHNNNNLKAVLAEVTLCPPSSLQVAHDTLSLIKGFLTLIPNSENENNNTISENFENNNIKVSKVFASFADEGSALHARALLSGKVVAGSGTRIFIERRRK
ncbi:hypothetical protein AGDE_08457 [Angomonas deanei]|nr:hypothetical protein AGDE_08457 [Angomonas deanei]|eukprot:EPY32895.1 hypothetical protein AGDE_08457 [Angomonas deanei]